MQTSTLLKIVLAGALLGLVFSGFSTADFAEHLDRQEHSVHCSFIPGIADRDATGASGCQVAMMSPYSSAFRQTIWGGIPVALPGMSAFAFLAYLALFILLMRPIHRRWLSFLTLAAALPLLVSVAMAVISIVTLGTLCKLCIGIYVASLVVFVGAVLAWRSMRPTISMDDETAEAPTQFLLPRQGPLGLIAVGVLFVAAPIAVWIAAAPEVDELVADCGLLDYPRDIYGVMVEVGSQAPRTAAVEVLDPLCPACRAFEDRLVAAGLDEKLARRLLLVPLDNTCNWMVDSAIHPGACTVSEAVLCAENRAEVLEWVFDEQEKIRHAAAKDPRAARRMVVERFPALKKCVGSARARSQINKSLRWAVRNRLPLFTPQLFIEGVKLCNEDIDLGLDYSVASLVDRHAAGTLPKLTRRRPPPPPIDAPEPEESVEPETVAEPETAKPETREPETDSGEPEVEDATPIEVEPSEPESAEPPDVEPTEEPADETPADEAAATEEIEL